MLFKKFQKIWSLLVIGAQIDSEKLGNIGEKTTFSEILRLFYFINLSKIVVKFSKIEIMQHGIS